MKDRQNFVNKNEKIKHYLLIFIILAVFFSCGQEAKTVIKRNPNPPLIKPAGSQNKIKFSEANASARSEKITLSPHIQIDRKYELLQVIDKNLDVDGYDEQILVVKEKNNENSNIQIIILDYDIIRNSYLATCQLKTYSSNKRTITVYTEDVIGDHAQELICQGTDKDGNLTVNIFKRTISPTGLGLYYKEIFKTKTSGSCEIKMMERSSSYRKGLKNGTSFPIIIMQNTPEKDNLDLIKTVYHWRYNIGRYEKSFQEKVPGQVIEESKLKALYQSREEDFEKFLDGAWFQIKNSGYFDASHLQEIIQFNARSKLISFYSEGIQEIYIWQSSKRTLYHGLIIYCYNELLPSLKKQILVTVTSVDVIDITISNQKKEGKFKKLGKSVADSLLPEPIFWKVDKKIEKALSGVYQNKNGDKIDFKLPYFTLYQGENTYQGGVSLFQLNTTVLQLQILNSHGQKKEVRNYALEYKQKQEANKITRELSLNSGKLTSRGFVGSENEVLYYVQVETISSKED